MLCLEELTQEELINWIRENVSDLNEGKIVLNVLRQRKEQIQKVRDKAHSQVEETNNQIEQLVKKYVDGPVLTGIRLRNWPVEAEQEYKRLDQLRQEARRRFEACLREETTIEWKIIEIQDEQIKQLNKRS